MIKKLKKGFTLVELIVVIAIIAILSTVAVVGYTRVVDKANVSNDTQLVRNLNERMQLDEAENGYKAPETAHEAFVLTEEFGFIIERLTPTSSGNDVVWDITTNRFALIDATDVEKVIYSDPTKTLSTNPIDLWKVSKTVPTSSKYSVYLAGTSIETAIPSLGVGVDVGRNTGVPSIAYTNLNASKGTNIVFRTDSYLTAITIDAPNDTVHHYGNVLDVNIVSVSKNASYHEFGRVAGAVSLTVGRFVLEDGGEATTLVINNSNPAEVSVVIEEEASVGALIDLNNVLDNSVAEKFNYIVTNNDTDNTVEEIITAQAYVEEDGKKVYYQNLQEAIDVGNGKTVVVLRDIEYQIDAGGYALKVGNLTENVVITLDLNGKVITGYLYNTKSCQVINVGGAVDSQGNTTAKLTIKDSTAPAGGYSTGAVYGLPSMSSDSWSVAVSTISVDRNGELVVESGKIINGYEGFEVTGDANPYAINVSTNTGAQAAKLTVNGGYIESKAISGVGIRAFCNSSVGIVFITINGGHIIGDSRAVMLQYPSNNRKCLLEFTINGGTLESATRALDVLNFNSAEITDSQFNITVNGGSFISHNDANRVKFPGSSILYISYTTNVTGHINFTDNR